MASAAVQRAIENLANQADTSTRIMERDRLINASGELKRHRASLQGEFKKTLHDLSSKDLEPNRPAEANIKSTDWMSLSLVGEEEEEDQLIAIRIINHLAQACEAEFREVLPFLGAVLETIRTDEDRNPIRPANIGRSVYAGISAVTKDHELRQIITRELSQTMVDGLRLTYVALRKELQQQGVEAVGFSVKKTDDSRPKAAQTPSGTGLPAAGSTADSRLAEPGSPGSEAQQSVSNYAEETHANGFQNPVTFNFENLKYPIDSFQDITEPRQQLSALLSKISQLSFEQTNTPGGRSSGAGQGPLDEVRQPSGASSEEDAARGEIAPTNLIRSYRSDLIQACNSKLDETVIDVVAGVFDQILSDPQVPTQIALLIARLQLPVLRVALLDNTFFSSRSHPVRRFVNRIASLSCAFDDFDNGLAEQLLAKMRDLIREISSNEVDEIDPYEAKVCELETFVSDLAQRPAGPEQNHFADLLAHKESELQVQQRYMLQLHSSLKQINIPAYLRDFLSQVWSQAIVLADREAGPDDERSKNTRRTARELIMSVQPKGSPDLRKEFIKRLPGLMKNLKEGLAMIGWPDEARDSFIAVLLATHSVALNQPPMSKLDYDMLSSELDSVFDTPIVGVEYKSPAGPAPAEEVEAPLEIEKLFTHEEAQSVGLVEEDSVDWLRKIDAPPADVDNAPDQRLLQSLVSCQGSNAACSLALKPDGGAIKRHLSLDTPLDDSEAFHIEVDQDTLNTELNLSLAEPPDPSEGPNLADHVRLGYAYYMIRKDKWQKVRLSFISPGRTFFAFTVGSSQRDVISCTARMVHRMCETGRLRAVESTDLLERATVRAVEQMATLQPPSSAVMD
jgi:hypothetical protein